MRVWAVAGVRESPLCGDGVRWWDEEGLWIIHYICAPPHARTGVGEEEVAFPQVHELEEGGVAGLHRLPGGRAELALD